MKFRVTSSMKGELMIDPLERGYEAGGEFSLTEEQFKNVGVQFALKNKMIESLDNAKPLEVDNVEFRNLTGGSVVIGGTGIRASAYEKFFVPAKLVDSHDVVTAVGDGIIIKESDYKKINKGKKVEKSEKKAKKIKKELLKETSDEVQKAPRNLNDLSKVPTGMYVARPDLQATAAEKIDMILNFEAKDEVEGPIAFADKKQEKQRLEKLQKILEKQKLQAKE
jgi:hypothetical protein